MVLRGSFVRARECVHAAHRDRPSVAHACPKMRNDTGKIDAFGSVSFETRLRRSMSASRVQARVALERARVGQALLVHAQRLRVHARELSCNANHDVERLVTTVVLSSHYHSFPVATLVGVGQRLEERLAPSWKAFVGTLTSTETYSAPRVAILHSERPSS